MNEILKTRGPRNVWLVIEGDNGAGKDTLAAQLPPVGFEIINAHAIAQSAEKRARTFSGEDKVSAFLEYNRLCAELVLGARSHAVQIRYWPSTLAAAYADEIMTWEQAQDVASLQAKLSVQPTIILYLECNLDERAKRITMRGPLLNRTDDVTERRAARHKAAMAAFSKRLNQWRNLDCSTLSPKEVFTQTLEILNNK